MDNISEWNINQVSQWLKQIKIPNDIIENFKQQQIDGEALLEMNKRSGKRSYDKLLKELGFISIGPLLKFQKILSNQIESSLDIGIGANGGRGDNLDIHYNEKLWWKVWRSKILKNHILQYYRLLSLNYNMKFHYKEELLNYANRDYITILKYEGVEALPKDYIPYGVRKLVFTGALQDIIPGSIPLSVKELIIEKNITSVLKSGSIPSSVETLQFGSGFNQTIPVDVIPNSVTALSFTSFNQPILPGSLVEGLKKLSLGSQFNQPIGQHLIPNTVVDLCLGASFNNTLVAGSIPSSVIRLSSNQGTIFKAISIPNCIPDSIKEFKLLGQLNLAIPLGLGCIPFSTQKLEFSEYFNQQILPGSIPLTVLSIKFNNFNQTLSVGSIPSSCTSLDMGGSFNRPITPKSIPLSVTSLSLGPSFNQSLNKSLPPSIVDLNLGGFNFPLLPGDIPFGVQNLCLENFNYPIAPNTLPSTLKTLKFGKSFNQYIAEDCIPKSTKIIKS